MIKAPISLHFSPKPWLQQALVLDSLNCYRALHTRMDPSPKQESERRNQKARNQRRKDVTTNVLTSCTNTKSHALRQKQDAHVLPASSGLSPRKPLNKQEEERSPKPEPSRPKLNSLLGGSGDVVIR